MDNNQEDNNDTIRPTFLTRIQKHYCRSSPDPTTRLTQLSPSDLHRKWMSGIHQYHEWSSVIMKIAPSVVSVSIFTGVTRKIDCTGLIIAWDNSTSKATIITSAKLARLPRDEVRDYYYIVVRLANGIILLAEEHYVDYYHNIMTLKAGEGGPLVTRMGNVCGINFFDGYKSVHPLPTSVILSCLDNWNSHRIVVQPWFGFTVIDLAELPYDAMETIVTGCCGPTTRTTAVIKQVYEGSPADEAGVCPGDLVIALDDIPISSAYQYSRALSTISGNLSASCTHQTLDSTRNIQVLVLVLVHGKDCHDDKVVFAKNLTVDDRRLCCSWPRDEDDWYQNPLVGSQTNYGINGMGGNNNAPSWLRDY